MENSKNTKSQILNESLKLFSQRSFHGASVREIAKAVKIRESAIYNHFSSKDEILIEIVKNFSDRNFGTIILNDKLIEHISKPKKFFLLLSQSIVKFWNSKDERMFIKILLNLNSIILEKKIYTVDDYLNDFRKLCSFIFKEMINHKFLRSIDPDLLSNQFISPLFLIELKRISLGDVTVNVKTDLELHADFIWNASKK